jgi:hypothetical protein
MWSRHTKLYAMAAASAPINLHCQALHVPLLLPCRCLSLLCVLLSTTPSPAWASPTLLPSPWGHLEADVLSLPVTVQPQDEPLAAPPQLLQRLRHGLVGLAQQQQPPQQRTIQAATGKTCESQLLLSCCA